MALLTRAPKRGLERFGLLDEIEEMRRGMFDLDRFPWLTFRQGRWMPFLDVFEKDAELVVRADLPGLNEKDVKVYMTDHTLVIEGERKEEEKVEEGAYYRHEVSYGEFVRRIELPEGVEPEKIVASYRNGILEVRVPKGTTAKPKEIPVEIG